MQRSLRKFAVGFKTLPETPKDKILYYNQLFNADSNPKKVNLTVGAYKDEKGKSWVLPSVLKAIDINRKSIVCDYLPIPGDPVYIDEALKLGYGVEGGKLAGVFDRANIAAVQSTSGTGALNLGLWFLKEYLNFSENHFYLPMPTWPIYNTMAPMLGLEPRPLPYYDEKKRVFEFEKYLQALETTPEGSLLSVQVCGHNPTGHDPSPEQWEKVAQIFAKRKFFAVMDMAYQGFVSGDPQKDNEPVKLFAQKGIKFILCQSFAKNFGLYGHRVGLVSVPTSSASEASRVADIISKRARNIHSNPPRFGSDVLRTILTSPELTSEWNKDVKTMADRIIVMRQEFLSAIRAKGEEEKWSYIAKQHGMFAFTHLSEQNVTRLREEFSVHCLPNGRISIPGLNPQNIKYVADSILEVTK